MDVDAVENAAGDALLTCSDYALGARALLLTVARVPLRAMLFGHRRGGKDSNEGASSDTQPRNDLGIGRLGGKQLQRLHVTGFQFGALESVAQLGHRPRHG